MSLNLNILPANFEICTNITDIYESDVLILPWRSEFSKGNLWTLISEGKVWWIDWFSFHHWISNTWPRNIVIKRDWGVLSMVLILVCDLPRSLDQRLFWIEFTQPLSSLRLSDVCPFVRFDSYGESVHVSLYIAKYMSLLLLCFQYN